MARIKPLDVDIDLLTTSQQAQLLPILAKRANSRLYTLRKQGVDYYAEAVARDFLTRRDREFFSGRTTGKTRKEIRAELNAIQRFLDSRSSTLTGIKSLREEQKQAFLEQGFVIKNDEQWFRFLNSNLFKTLANRVSSDLILEDVQLALNEGFSLDEIRNDYISFLASEEMTFEQIDEKRGGRVKLQ